MKKRLGELFMPGEWKMEALLCYLSCEVRHQPGPMCLTNDIV